MIIRRAERGDLDAIVGFYRADPVHHEPAEGDWASAFEAIAADPREMLVVAEEKNRVIGTLQITWLRYLTYGGAHVALVEAVQVAASERNRGVGAALMRFAIDEARRRGCHRMQLTSNKARKDAHRFYERLGFTASHEGFKLFLEAP
ncbi:MAG TPA: GNAT family N-acetyltransferase [Polyangiaceae bacterium]